MPQIVNQIGNRHLLFRKGEFLNCTIKGVHEKNAEIIKIEDAELTIRTAKGDILVSPNDVKPVLKFGNPEPSARNVYSTEKGVLFAYDSPDSYLYQTKGVLIYGASKKTTITVETTAAATVNITNYDDGKIEVSVINAPPPLTNRPPIIINGPIDNDLLASLSKSPENYGLEIIFTG